MSTEETKPNDGEANNNNQSQTGEPAAAPSTTAPSTNEARPAHARARPSLLLSISGQNKRRPN